MFAKLTTPVCNTDTLKLAGASLNKLDLTQIDNNRIQNIGIIDITGSDDKVEATRFNKSEVTDVVRGYSITTLGYHFTSLTKG
jgi:hypothetical protein